MLAFQEWASSYIVPEPQSDGAQADTSAGERLHELHQGDQTAELWDGEPGPRHQTVRNKQTLLCSLCSLCLFYTVLLIQLRNKHPAICWGGNQSYIVLYQTSQAHGRGATLSDTSCKSVKWFSNYYLNVQKLHRVVLRSDSFSVCSSNRVNTSNLFYAALL